MKSIEFAIDAIRMCAAKEAQDVTLRTLRSEISARIPSGTDAWKQGYEAGRRDALQAIDEHRRMK